MGRLKALNFSVINVVPLTYNFQSNLKIIIIIK